MHYYQFNIGDYASSTQHLEPMEDLAYRRMLDLYYSKETPLPLDVQQIARLIRMRSHTDCIEVVLQDFFTKETDGWHNKGADKLIGKIHQKSEAAKRSANARWNKNKHLDASERTNNASQTKCEDDANALRTHSGMDADGMLPNTQYPIPKTQDTRNNNQEKDDRVSDAFNKFWSSYHKKQGKAQAERAFKAAVKREKIKDPDGFAGELINDCQQRLKVNQFGFDNLNASTYLNNNRWEDEIVTERTEKSDDPWDDIWIPNWDKKKGTFKEPGA